MLDYAAFPQQRQALIREILQQNGRVVCADLARQMAVSEHTIRRDLHELSKEGLCKKVYGGAVLQLPDAGSFISRKEHDHAAKALIAQRCARLVKADSCIFIDAGTTNLALAQALPPEMRLTVVTNAPDIAALLINHPVAEVIMLGGQILKSTGGAVGQTAINQIQGILFDQAFIGGCAMSPEAGLTGFDYADCEFKKVAMAQSNQVIVGLTADKIPAVARFSVAKCCDISTLVVEEKLDKTLLEAFAAEEVTLITV
ncbi:DeoR/GlpR family DNA-binding transcription regulator [Pantoea sp. Lij88]|uniref:DeoR/GlpR family DNA-binding transcription regulator n=1 Tax=Pantoea sp. Lij88 TaxID=3028622 RepID=UPI0024BA2C67|nr:DeoR/GlpR family DNA-binding transcription regulator [Pantoea sp. Lij88]WHQ73206.1 DeoR/GlpR family DNA-binding transcription regulator [Pantoea sp. Lij88]